MRRPKARWGWTSMKCASGTASAGTSPWPCWPRPFWRWLGIRRPRGDRVKRGLPRRGGRADTDDGARGAPIALPAGLDALPPGGFGVGLVSVETPTSGQSPALSLSTPPQTSSIICATVVLSSDAGLGSSNLVIVCLLVIGEVEHLVVALQGACEGGVCDDRRGDSPECVALIWFGR